MTEHNLEVDHRPAKASEDTPAVKGALVSKIALTDLRDGGKRDRFQIQGVTLHVSAALFSTINAHQTGLFQSLRQENQYVQVKSMGSYHGANISVAFESNIPAE